MLWLAAKIILSVLGIFIAMFVLFLAIRESISHIRLQYYIKQQKSNCVIDKSPAFMNIVNVIKSITTFKDIWHIKKVKHTQPELLKADIYIEKDFRSCNIKINPLSEKSYIEFFQKELEHTVKTSFAGVEFLGFVHESGEKAMHQRMIFKEMFHFDRLIKTLPKIRFIIREHTSLLKK
jgi:hypothetical protein